MKFSTSATVLATLATLIAVNAAPIDTESTEVASSGAPDEFSVPQEAITGDIQLSSDEYPLIVQTETGFEIVIVNTTIVDQAFAESGLNKRDANADADPWLWWRVGQPAKRDANADADPWLWWRVGQPAKRDANADADAVAQADPWLWWRVGQPAKRDANADADPWLWWRVGQPAKRDANADADPWLWWRVGQPAKRDANADADPWLWWRVGQPAK